ncbi:MAG: hypothetical protein COC08_06955 [Maribacter sp.]|nr:MAG: hypothetical protein COC08_06955 [Maribacter sp.]
MEFKTILLLGRTGIDVQNVKESISVKNVNLLSGTSFNEVETAFEDNNIDIVIMGAGIDLDIRTAIVQHIFTTSKSTSVHMKDWDSGPQGMVPFIDGVLRGLIGDTA